MFRTQAIGVLLLALGLLTSACSTTTGTITTSAWMPVGAPAVAPHGFEEFCRQNRAECVGDEAAPDLLIAEADAADAVEPAPAPEFIPAMLILPETEATAATVTGGERYAPAEPGFARILARAAEEPIETPLAKEAVWPLLKRVNAEINGQIRAATDQEIYGVNERWAMPLTQGALRSGDCEDYALEKRHALLAAGVPESAMFFAMGMHRRYGRHLMLVVSTDEGDYVLDSLNPWIVRWDEAAYEWRTRQVSARSLDWVAIRENPPQLMAVTASEDPAG